MFLEMNRAHDSAPERAPFGSITPWQGKWRLRYTDNAKNRRSGGVFDSYDDAWFECARLGVLFRAGKLTAEAIEGGRGTGGDVSAETSAVITVQGWLKQQKEVRRDSLSEESFINEQSYVKRVEDIWGDCVISGLTAEAIREWSKAIQKWWDSPELHVSASSRKHTYSCLSAHLRLAVEAGHLLWNPAKVKGAWRRVSPQRPRRTEDEAKAIIAELPEDLRILATLSGDCHLRPGEARGLNRGDYDPKTGRLHVERRDSTKGKRHLAAPKNESFGSVKVTPRMMKLIERHLEGLPAGVPGDPMFPGQRCPRVSHSYVRRAWERAREAVGDLNWHVHDLRGVGLTAMEELGISRKDLKSRSRHKSDEALAVYLHTDERRDADVAAQWTWLPASEDQGATAQSSEDTAA